VDAPADASRARRLDPRREAGRRVRREGHPEQLEVDLALSERQAGGLRLRRDEGRGARRAEPVELFVEAVDQAGRVPAVSEVRSQEGEDLGAWIGHGPI